MEVFQVFIVNRLTCKVLRQTLLVGSTEGDAALQLTLTEEEQKLKDDDDLEILYNSVGSFEKRVVQRIRMENK